MKYRVWTNDAESKLIDAVDRVEAIRKYAENNAFRYSKTFCVIEEGDESSTVLSRYKVQWVLSIDEINKQQ